MSTDQSGPGRPAWDQPYMNAPSMPEAREKKGLGCGCLVLIGLAVLAALLMFLCCGGALWMGAHFASSASLDPEVTVAVTEEIVRMDIPEGLEPTGSIDVEWPVVGGKAATGVAYADESTESVLILASFGEVFDDEPEQDELLRQFDEDVLREQGFSPQTNVPEWDVDQREIEVRGEPVPFRFAVGEDINTGARRIEVTGRFEGEDGPVKFWLRADADQYDEARIVQAIESIE